MAKNSEKIARNKIREKYAKEYAGKLKHKDDQIRQLCDKIDQLQARIKFLEGKSSLDLVTIQCQDELIKTLQAWSELSESELAKLKQDLERRSAVAKSIGTIGSLVSAIQGVLDAQMPGHGLQTALYAIYNHLGV